MMFAHPWALVFGLLAIPIVWLYRRTAALRREPASAAMIWEQVLAEERARMAWQRWRGRASLAVELLILAVLVLALAGPWIPPPRPTVLVIDNSVSMNAADVAPSRLAAAKEVARQAVAARRSCDRMAIISAGRPARICCTLTDDPAILEQAVGSIVAGHGPTDVEQALSLASRILSRETRGRVVMVSDGCFPAPDADVQGLPDIEGIRVGQASGNVAITRLAARRNTTDAGTGQILAEVTNFSAAPVECRLTVDVEGQPAVTTQVRLAADQRWQQVFDAAAPPGSPQVKARIDHADVLVDDNQALCRLLMPAQPMFVVPTQIQPPAAGFALPWPRPAPLAMQPSIDASRRDSRVNENETVAVGAGTGPLVAGCDATTTCGQDSDLRAGSAWGMPAEDKVWGRAGAPLWVYLAGLAIALSAAQWCLYQRRWLS